MVKNVNIVLIFFLGKKSLSEDIPEASFSKMSTGGVFTLITNQGLQDKLIMATDMLNARLREISRIRCKNPAIRDSTPTLVDIERTHILYINAHYKPFCAIGYEYQKTPVSLGIQDLGEQITFSIPQFGDFFHDMVVHLKLTGLTATGGDQVYYTDFLGHRIMKQVQFEVNGNYLDQYDSNVMNFHYNYFVPTHKKDSWLKAVGQETPENAYLTLNPGVDEYRELKFIVNGPQTPKAVHPEVDLWIPLLFWFNRDPRLAVPSVAVPYGQRFMKITLAAADEICASVSGAPFIPPQLAVADIYINNIFVNPEIHDIFIKRIGFALIRVHLIQIFNEKDGGDQLELAKFKFPVETIYLGLRPTINVIGADNMTDWWRYHNVITTLIPYPVARVNPVPPPTYLLDFSQAIWKTATRSIDTIAILNHGVPLYEPTPFEFFQRYIPYNYGKNITSPVDPGLAMITFNLHPGIYNPSGHFNFSQARQTFLNWTGASISPSNPADMVVVAIALNFLLIAESTMVLRFNV